MSDDPDEHAYVTRKEVLAFGVHGSTLAEWVRTGTVEVLQRRPGGHGREAKGNLYRLKDVEAAIREVNRKRLREPSK